MFEHSLKHVCSFKIVLKKKIQHDKDVVGHEIRLHWQTQRISLFNRSIWVFVQFTVNCLQSEFAIERFFISLPSLAHEWRFESRGMRSFNMLVLISLNRLWALPYPSSHITNNDAILNFIIFVSTFYDFSLSDKIVSCDMKGTQSGRSWHSLLPRKIQAKIKSRREISQVELNVNPLVGLFFAKSANDWVDTLGHGGVECLAWLFKILSEMVGWAGKLFQLKAKFCSSSPCHVAWKKKNVECLSC